MGLSQDYWEQARRRRIARLEQAIEATLKQLSDLEFLLTQAESETFEEAQRDQALAKAKEQREV